MILQPVGRVVLSSQAELRRRIRVGMRWCSLPVRPRLAADRPVSEVATGKIEIAKGYIVCTEQIHDQAKMDEYGARAMPALFGVGGTVIAVDDAVDCREGSWHGARTVILEFESTDAARSWYESPDYQAAIPFRQAGAETNVAIVSGFEAPG